MPAAPGVVADLQFEVELPGHDVVHGTLRGRGPVLLLEVDHPEAFAGRADAAAIRGLADILAERRLAVRVEHRGRHLVTLGATHAPWWQRRVTGSRRIRLGSVRGQWSSGRAKLAGSSSAALPDVSLVPPSTLSPIAPTFLRRSRRRVSTTHDPGRGGGPRLVLAVGDHHFPGDRQTVFWLDQEVVTIGSDPGCDIRLPGLAALHAEVVHDQEDELVLVAHEPETRVGGARIERHVLRTGSRVQLGTHALGYFREEYADHGRPHGGRIGGELGHQRPQPERPRLQRHDLEGPS